MIGLYLDIRKDGYHVIEGPKGEVESFSPVIDLGFVQQRYRELTAESFKSMFPDE